MLPEITTVRKRHEPGTRDLAVYLGAAGLGGTYIGDLRWVKPEDGGWVPVPAGTGVALPAFAKKDDAIAALIVSP